MEGIRTGVALIAVASLFVFFAGFSSAGTSNVEERDLLPVHSVDDYRIGLLDTQELRENARAGETSALEFQDIKFHVHLELYNMRSDDFAALSIENGTVQELDIGPPTTYRGHVVEAEGVSPPDRVIFNINDEGVTGALAHQEGAWLIEPITEKGEGLHIIYHDYDLNPPGIQINATSEETQELEENIASLDDTRNGSGPSLHSSDFETTEISTSSTSGITALVTGVADDSFINDMHDGNFGAAVSQIEEDINIFAGILENDLVYPKIQLRNIAAVSEEDLGDPDDQSAFLQAFRDYMNEEFWDDFLQPDDSPHWNFANLWTGNEVGTDNCGAFNQSGCVWGVAYEGGLGKETAYSFVQANNEGCVFSTHPFYCPENVDWHRHYVVAHELGHVWGGNHCHPEYKDDQKTLMSKWNSEVCKDDGTGDGFVWRYSNQTAGWSSDDGTHDNRDGMSTVLFSNLVPPSVVPSSPDGEPSFHVGEKKPFGFNVPSEYCAVGPSNEGGYEQISWGDGELTSRMPGTAAQRCDQETNFVEEKSWNEPGQYEITYKIRAGYLAPFGPWSDSFTVEVLGLTGTSITTVPSTVEMGEPFQVCWDVEGTGDIDHTNVHWTEGDGTQHFTPGRTGTAPDSYCETIDAPSEEQTISIRSHASGPNTDFLSSVHKVEIVEPDQLTGVEVTSVPGSVAPGESFTVCWSVTGSGAIDHTNLHWNFNDGTTQFTDTQTGEAPDSFCDSISAPNDEGTISLEAHASGPNDNLFSSEHIVDVLEEEVGNIIAQHEDVIRSEGSSGDTGTLISFSGVSASGDIQVSYSYCYLADTNGRTAFIDTTFDGTLVDSNDFHKPYTGGDTSDETCDAGDASTFAERSFTVSGASISDTIAFDYTNGDWRIEIAEIVVRHASEGDFFETFESGSAPGWSLSGLWHVDDQCSAPETGGHYLGYHLQSACSYDTGNANQGSASFTVDLSQASSASLSFTHFFEVEEVNGAYDMMRVEIRQVGDSEWDFLDQWDARDGTNGGWTDEAYDIDAWAGAEVEIRFHFDTVDDIDNDFQGWHIDRVEVSTSSTSTTASMETSSNPIVVELPPSGNETIDPNANQTLSGALGYVLPTGLFEVEASNA